MKRREGERWREKQIPDIYVTNKQIIDCVDKCINH